MLILKFILAFCSLAYELILAQGLSAFLDNTVLRYSTTIGLYMFAMGLGTLISGRVDLRRPALVLWQAEILLVVFGAGSVISLFFFSGLNVSAVLIVVWAYVLVALIGFLTGFELPLMLHMSSREGRPSRGRIMAIDYAGALAATIVFVFYFYSFAGLVRSAMMVALLNALAAAVVAVRWREDFGFCRDAAILASLSLVGGALAVFLFSGPLEAQLITHYLTRGN